MRLGSKAFLPLVIKIRKTMENSLSGSRNMLYQITDGTVAVGGETVLSHISFEIKGNEKIALVGRI